MLKTISVIVSGKVQGVFYRQNTKEKAVEFGITGEIKNLQDGNVSIIATGTEEQLNKLTDWCKKGPPRAVVTGVEVAEIALQPFEKFSITR
ncbi:MAG: acylphosphatase [Chitinophagaceae bacterium]|nr:acylphosphatase [Chitinophagaceae bacterium]